MPIPPAIAKQECRLLYGPVFKSPAYTDLTQTATVIQTLNRRVYQEWLPTAPYMLQEGFDMELYYGDEDTIGMKYGFGCNPYKGSNAKRAA